jgi:hypothetical protein
MVKFEKEAVLAYFKFYITDNCKFKKTNIAW